MFKKTRKNAENSIENSTEQVPTGEQKQSVDWMRIGKLLLFPHTIVIFLLFNLCVAGLIYIFMNHWEESLPAILFYVVAFYTLVVVCARIPRIVIWAKNRADSNEHIHNYLTDRDLRMRESMYRGLIITGGFAMFKVILGFIYQSPWLFAMAGYNMVLSLMRLVLVIRGQKKGLDEQQLRRRGLQSYRVCGWMMLVLNIAISVIMFMVIVQKQTISYHMIVTIGLAAFTFYSFTMAIINFIRYRKRVNPVYSALKRIDLAKAIVSIFTLQVAMLTCFGDGTVNVGLMNTLTGAAVTIAINTIAALMLAGVKKDYRLLEVQED